ncbi:MAG: hypothetical protein ACXADS_15415 [Candidatus Thorarchaeota archaeon]|jgi:hypothetical protein
MDFKDVVSVVREGRKTETSIWEQARSAEFSAWNKRILDIKGLIGPDYNKRFRELSQEHTEIQQELDTVLTNSTYRSIKSVLKNAVRYGIQLEDKEGKITGKSAVDKARQGHCPHQERPRERAYGYQEQDQEDLKQC